MHAIVQHQFGPPDQLRYEEVPDPRPADGEVAIAVQASGVHLIDTVIRRGVRRGSFPLPDLPMIPGREVAGVVDEIGPDVDPRWMGRRVVAHLGQANGGHAQRAVAPVTALHDVPDHLEAKVAVAAIGTGRTAVGVLDMAGLTTDDVVVVTAAAGGLGSLFVQGARDVEAVVVGLAGGRDKVARVRDLGADIAVDYLEPDWPDRVHEALDDREVSVVLDGVGGTTGRAAMDLLGVGGRLVMFGWASGEPTQVITQDLVARSLTVSWGIGPGILQPARMRDLETRALKATAAGQLVPVVQPFPLAEAHRAHTALEQRATIGKVVLVNEQEPTVPRLTRQRHTSDPGRSSSSG